MDAWDGIPPFFLKVRSPSHAVRCAATTVLRLSSPLEHRAAPGWHAPVGGIISTTLTDQLYPSCLLGEKAYAPSVPFLVSPLHYAEL